MLVNVFMEYTFLKKFLRYRQIQSSLIPEMKYALTDLANCHSDIKLCFSNLLI